MANPQPQKPWRAEYAKSARSSCKTCKSNIAKETFRLGKMVQATQFDGFMPVCLYPFLLSSPLLFLLFLFYNPHFLKPINHVVFLHSPCYSCECIWVVGSPGFDGFYIHSAGDHFSCSFFPFLFLFCFVVTSATDYSTLHVS